MVSRATAPPSSALSEEPGVAEALWLDSVATLLAPELLTLEEPMTAELEGLLDERDTPEAEEVPLDLETTAEDEVAEDEIAEDEELEGVAEEDGVLPGGRNWNVSLSE